MILRILSRKGTVPVHELLHEMPLSGPTVSHHLSKLRKMKFITHGGAGGYIYYSINEEDQLKRHVLVKILLDSLE
jgi:DNA-binding transcriptional ArsR family regulator